MGEACPIDIRLRGKRPVILVPPDYGTLDSPFGKGGNRVSFPTACLMPFNNALSNMESGVISEV